MNSEIEHGLDTTPEVWDFMQQHGLNDAHVDSGTLNLVTAGVSKTYYSLPTPVRQACEIWGIIAVLKLSIEPSLVAASTLASPNLNGRVGTTYTQPQPPALNNTTDAATQGNLEFRNFFYDREFNIGTAIAQPVTQGAQVGPQSQVFSDILFLKKPRRIALSQLETQIIIGSTSGLNASGVDFTVDFLYKFVTVSETEYNALVALSSGQAVLSEVIVA